MRNNELWPKGHISILNGKEYRGRRMMAILGGDSLGLQVATVADASATNQVVVQRQCCLECAFEECVKRDWRLVLSCFGSGGGDS